MRVCRACAALAAAPDQRGAVEAAALYPRCAHTDAQWFETRSRRNKIIRRNDLFCHVVATRLSMCCNFFVEHCDKDRDGVLDSSLSDPYCIAHRHLAY